MSLAARMGETRMDQHTQEAPTCGNAIQPHLFFPRPPCPTGSRSSAPMKAFLSLLFVALLGSSAAFGQESAAPPIVDKGFDELLKNGSLAAMAVWLAGS